MLPVLVKSPVIVHRRGGVLQFEVARVAGEPGQRGIVREVVGVGDEAGGVGEIEDGA